MHAELDELDEARALIAEALPIMQKTNQMGPLLQIVGFVERLGVRDSLLEAVRASQLRRAVFFRTAAILAMDGELIAAADFVSQTGAVTMESQLRFRGGLQLVAAGRHEEGKAELERALEFYRSVDARAYVAQIEATLAGAQSASA